MKLNYHLFSVVTATLQLLGNSLLYLFAYGNVDSDLQFIQKVTWPLPSNYCSSNLFLMWLHDGIKCETCTGVLSVKISLCQSTHSFCWMKVFDGLKGEITPQNSITGLCVIASANIMWFCLCKASDAEQDFVSLVQFGNILLAV